MDRFLALLLACEPIPMSLIAEVSANTEHRQWLADLARHAGYDSHDMTTDCLVHLHVT